MDKGKEYSGLHFSVKRYCYFRIECDNKSCYLSDRRYFYLNMSLGISIIQTINEGPSFIIIHQISTISIAEGYVPIYNLVKE